MARSCRALRLERLLIRDQRERDGQPRSIRECRFECRVVVAAGRATLKPRRRSGAVDDAADRYPSSLPYSLSTLNTTVDALARAIDTAKFANRSPTGTDTARMRDSVSVYVRCVVFTSRAVGARRVAVAGEGEPAVLECQADPDEVALGSPATVVAGGWVVDQAARPSEAMEDLVVVMAGRLDRQEVSRACGAEVVALVLADQRTFARGAHAALRERNVVGDVRDPAEVDRTELEGRIADERGRDVPEPLPPDAPPAPDPPAPPARSSQGNMPIRAPHG